MSKLLAIGGPKSFKWLTESDSYELMIPIPSKVSFDPAPQFDALQVHIYRKMLLTNYATEERKLVYVSESLPLAEADKLLKEWLLNQFISMDNPDDSD